MEKSYKVLFVDDDHRYSKTLIDRASGKGIELVHFDNWEEAKSELDESFDDYEAVIVDGKGKLTKDSPGDDQIHVSRALKDLNKMIGAGKYVPYVILSKYLEVKKAIDDIFFEKIRDENEMFEYLIFAIENSEKHKIKAKYPEPFSCFGEKYLDNKHEKFLINIIRVFESEKIENPENLLFNPCRIMLEQIFREINHIAPRILPSALINYEEQRVPLDICLNYLSGTLEKIKGYSGIKFPDYRGNKVLPDYISEQIQTIIAVCHPSSHEIQDKYSKYTFMSVLWALFDVLIWLKRFIDERQLSRKID